MPLPRIPKMSRARALALAVTAAALLAPGLVRAATGLSFLRMGVGARATALGDAVVSHVDDPSATYWNPGAVPLLSGTQAQLSHNESYQGIRSEFASITRQQGRSGMGVNFNGVWTDRLWAYDERGEFQGEFSYYDIAIDATYGRALSDRVGIGAGLEYLREVIDVNTASGMAGNVGLQMRGILPRTNLGFAIRHLGGSMKFVDESFDLPMTIQGGISHLLPLNAIGGSLLIAADVRHARGEDTQLLLGTEYSYQDVARLQVGYRSGIETQDVSMGIGVGRGAVRAEYAFVPTSENLGDQHRISLLMRW